MLRSTKNCSPGSDNVTDTFKHVVPGKSENSQSPQESNHSAALGGDPVARGVLILLGMYFMVEYGRIHDFVPPLSALRPGMIFAIGLFFYWLVKGDKSILVDPLVKLYISFLALLAISMTYTVNHFAAYQVVQVMTIYLLAGILPLGTFLARPDELTKFLRFLLVVQVAVAITSALRGGVGTSSFLSDENDLALHFNTALPYAYCLWKSPYASKIGKALFLGCMAAIVVVIVVSSSRGGLVGLAATFGAIVLFFPNRTRNILAACAAAMIGLFFVSDAYIADMSTISDQNDRTRLDRLYSWSRAWEMFVDNPVLGVGAGNFPWRFPEYELRSPEYDPHTMRLHGGRQAHSLYFTLFPETGLLGTTIYLAIVGVLMLKLRSVARSLRHLRQSLPIAAELYLLTSAIAASVVGYLVSGVFISVLYYPQLWYTLGIVIALDRATRYLVDRSPAGAGQPNLEADTPHEPATATERQTGC